MQKLHFAIKTSLALVLAYIIPFAMGWSQANTAVITIILIASAGNVSDSVTKGAIRVLGTVLGSIIGLGLIALFPQERMFYLISLSIVLMILIYLYYTYQGDSTVFMLSAMTIMMMFVNGPENAFLYGIDKTYMTIFGILIYTFIGIFLWPNKAKPGTINDAPKGRMFIWLDPEYFKATLQLMCVYWFSVAFWIYFNPPAGFLVVTLATLIGLLTMFSPLKPTILMILFTAGFSFSTLMYVAVLPHLIYGWELALFVFMYGFIGFYFIKPQISIFFLLGLFVLNITNEMHYNFDTFLLTLLIFYMFLIILMFFHNFPFSARPEHLFGLMKERFVKHTQALQEIQKKENKNFLDRLREQHHATQLKQTVQKMQIWHKKIDTSYFHKNSSESLLAFAQNCMAYIKQETTLQNCYNSMNTIDWNNLKMAKF
ncbi:FUSC family protein [Sulfurimonas paralvinellae]|uniref:FUSC family protein n=1 Tax=Sulfurimonas paralvinellae TaxID=317658 RepID=A0A7M1B853_9BACT|nr:FUSC family protein [Sulfurimonas paralvinellae]QOP45626.1 hypothetical protein FM071_04720 [Sulfurimonas paralvinellae]